MSADHHASTASAIRRKSVAEEPVTSVLAPGETPVFDRELTADEEVLAALGYMYALSSLPPAQVTTLTCSQPRVQA